MRKLKLLSLFAAVLFATSMWGQSGETEGPWTWMDMRSGCCDRTLNYSIAFDGLNNSHWGNISFWNNGDGIGYTVKGSSANQQKNGVFSTYYIDQNVESYSKKVLTWKFKVGSKDTKHYSNTALYALQGTWQQINALTVDFTEEYNNQAGSSYLIGQYRNTSYNKAYTGEITKTFEFNNNQGSSATTKSWCLLLTHVASSGDGMSDIHEWGAFQSVSATWTTYYYKYVTFNANQGSGSMSQQTIENSGKLKANAFSRTGYTFDGWATSSTGSKAYDNQGDISATSGSKGNVTLYARWKANTYTVTLDRQNGTGGSGSVTATYASAMPSMTKPTRTGYTFQGYYTEANGKGTKYYNANGTSAKNWDKTAATTLYAYWTAENYTISYTLNGGSVSGNPANYNIETATFTLNNPTRTGYTFKGWTGSNGNTPQTNVQIAKGSTGNKTYTANWTPITYTITYDLAGGQGTNPATYTVETPTFQLAVTRLGYTFLGWTGSNGEVPQPIVQIATGSTGNKNYTANWAINPSTNVVYLDSLDQTAAQETVAFNRPEAPEVAGFTFVRWEVKEGPLSEGIKLQAIYTENKPSGAPKKQVGKFTLIRKEGAENEYILQTAK